MNVIKKGIHKETSYLAKDVKDSFPNARDLSIDLLWNEENLRLEINKISIFVLIYTFAQLKGDNISGRYIFENGEFMFEEGRFWIQELILKGVITELLNNQLLEQ